ncbi:hypothetical protein CVT24_009733 [Panaeolus cyanescens]|uniref:HMG box domain-containing protein n=1 Tax=Panaeolus cyanescens TaxID=181874 RepID=A0A409Y9K9_9AGAR|nr:hypothetical protein CVT24_009733 [Panaeolus cyanescens]
MPKQTSSKKGKAKAQDDPDRSPSPVPDALVISDYLPAGFSIPLPPMPTDNFLDEQGQVKRPPNSWICYRSESTRVMREMHTVDEGGNEKFMDQGLVSRLCSQMWNSMTKEEKAPWMRHAALLAAEHKRLYPNYVFAPKTKEQKEKEKRDGKPVGKGTKRVPSKSKARAQADPYPQPAPVARLVPPTPIAGPSNPSYPSSSQQPLPYIPPPSTDLSSNPYAALTTLPYKVMPTFKPFPLPLPVPPESASPSMLDYTPSPATVAVPTPEPSVDPLPVKPEDEQPQPAFPQLFEWEMDEFFMSLAQLDVPGYASNVMSSDANPAQLSAGILPVLAFEAEPGMSVAVGNLPGQDAVQMSTNITATAPPPPESQDAATPLPELGQDWMVQHPLQDDFVSLASNEVWPGGEWLWGMGDTSATSFGGQSLQPQEMQSDGNVAPVDPWFQPQDQVNNDPLAWNPEPDTLAQDTSAVEAGYGDQGQLQDTFDVENYYTENTTSLSTYVPPTGAPFSANRRVGGTWQLHTRS